MTFARGVRTATVGAVDDLAKRLEMLLVLQWLDEGRPEDGCVALSVRTAAADLGLDADRHGVLRVMAALGDLEDERLVRVRLGAHTRQDPRVTLAPDLRIDAARMFGSDDGRRAT